jgi:hypothetical protein
LGKVGAFGKAEVAPGSGEVDGQFGDVAVGPDGQVLVTYQGGVGDAGNEGPSNIFFNVDGDGLGPGGFDPRGEVTETQVGQRRMVPPQSNDQGIGAEANLAWSLTGAHKGRIYLVYLSAPNPETNNTDVYVKFSDDDGATWSARHRVNDVRTHSRFLPSITLDQTTGNVGVAWYDSRNAPNNRNAELFASVSSDGGVTWAANVKVSAGMSNSHKSEPPGDDNRPIGYGDFIKDASFTKGVFYPVWADNSNSTKNNPNGKFSKLDIYTAKVTVTPGPSFAADAAPAAGVHRHRHVGTGLPLDAGLASAASGAAAGLLDPSLAAAVFSATHQAAAAPGSRLPEGSLSRSVDSLTETEAAALAQAASVADSLVSGQTAAAFGVGGAVAADGGGFLDTVAASLFADAEGS